MPLLCFNLNFVVRSAGESGTGKNGTQQLLNHTERVHVRKWKIVVNFVLKNVTQRPLSIQYTFRGYSYRTVPEPLLLGTYSEALCRSGRVEGKIGVSSRCRFDLEKIQELCTKCYLCQK
ncbi:hypothetical protein SOVF_117230 [Spinacia oleracea]|nr:hypothetical protein SOVF_117230 [Spinacia oleracea]